MSENKDIVVLKIDESNQVTIHLHGATITSWISKSREILFLSKNSVFDNKKAIRGGIPIVFPNFGPWPLGPQHGFARVKKWTLSDSTNDENSASAVFKLFDDEETRKMWNFSFELNYTIRLTRDSLENSLTVYNKGTDQFDFTSLLHTYIKIDDINNLKISGLLGSKYLDKVINSGLNTEMNEEVKISSETDRVYISTGDSHDIKSGTLSVTLKKTNFPDTVVWNPWIEKAKALSDFDNEEYKVMICVESGFVNNRYLLKSNEFVTMKQVILNNSV